MKKLFVYLWPLICLTITSGLGFACNDNAKNDQQLLYDCERKVIVIDNESEVNRGIALENRLHKILYSFIVLNREVDRAGGVCLMCGTENLTSGIMQEEIAIKAISCPGTVNSNWSDLVVKYSVYDIERCTACGYNRKLNFIGNKWTTFCKANNSNTPYIVVPGATIQQGYDIHQCVATF